MIYFRRNGLRVAESYYESAGEEPVKADIHRMTTSVPLDALRDRERSGHCLVIDLTQSEDALFAGMNETTRQMVKKGMKDEMTCTCDVACTPGVIGSFCDYYDGFAATKGLEKVFRQRLFLLAEQHRLAITNVAFNDGMGLAWHAYLRTPERAVLLYSASHFRQLKDDPRSKAIMRATRFLHWNDMVAFRDLGLTVYDMGGLDATGKTEETKKIAQFKMAFGGSVAPVYSYTVPVSLAGTVACKVLAMMGANY